MKVGFSTLALLGWLLPADLVAQVKQWTDEKGVTHFESHGPVRRPGDATPQLSNEPLRTKRPIDRTSLGVSLGDLISTYRIDSKWFAVGSEDRSGGLIMSKRLDSLEEGVKVLRAMFVDGRLASVRATYSESRVGGWESLIKSTSQTYGVPPRGGASTAVWSDDVTLLSFTKNYAGGIDVGLSDIVAMQRYNARTGQSAPKF